MRSFEYLYFLLPNNPKRILEIPLEVKINLKDARQIILNSNTSVLKFALLRKNGVP